jgi:hypothetical protein
MGLLPIDWVMVVHVFAVDNALDIVFAIKTPKPPFGSKLKNGDKNVA